MKPVELFVMKGEDVSGPMGREEFLNLLGKGSIKPDSMTSINGDEWQPAYLARTKLIHMTEAALAEKIATLQVSTGDVRGDYKVIGPVVFCLSNRGIMKSQFETLREKHKSALQKQRARGHLNGETDGGDILVGLLTGDLNFEARTYDQALWIGFEEMRSRAVRVGADAVIWVRQDMHIDNSGMEYFYLQVTGTAVRFC